MLKKNFLRLKKDIFVQPHGNCKRDKDKRKR